MIDTHSHIYSEEFDEDRAEVVARAEAAGVKLILLPAIDSKSHERQEALAASRPDLFRQMMGLHPTSVDENYEAELEIVREKLFGDYVPQKKQKGEKLSGINASEDVTQKARKTQKYVAIGEIGLDFYWDTTFREQQIEVLKRQLRWAEELDLPVVLHLRSGKDVNDNNNNAYAVAFDIMQCSQQHSSIEPKGDRREVSTLNSQLSTIRGIMHCFSGSLEDARRAVEMGFLLGIGGVVTYKKSTLPEIVREVGLENIVLETDAPYLAPVPYRGKRNESAYVRFVAEKVAEILGVSVEEVDAVTSRFPCLSHGDREM